MKLFFSDQDIDEEHFHFWNHVHISQIGENIRGRRPPPQKKTLFWGWSDTVNDDNFGYVSRRK